ncbi:uncharacterized protein LOC141631881 [Silene latifolia]|uniref:uncharacterized protein LOC141631881 n=1 Tax=Silene latifolia TaxID=37657 RepID=UPI003D785359
MGYYWPTMVQYCMDFAKKCDACQFNANFIHQPPEPLHPTISSWPFEIWGLDIVGPITPKASNGHEFILAATDYFSKWVEVISIFNKLMTSLGEKFKFKQYKSSIYNAPANGLAEAFNKTLCNLLRKVVARVAIRTSNSIFKSCHSEELTSDDNDKLRLEELEALYEKRLQAQQNLQCYQARLSRAFNKKVRPQSFQVGDLVLAVRRSIITSHKLKGKFTSMWDGPYDVQEVYTNGAYKIIDEDGVDVGPINGKFLKGYYS